MKNYIPGTIVSLILLIIFQLINSNIYHNVMPMNVIITLLVMQVVFSKYWITEKKRYPYFFFIPLFVIGVYFSLPEFTFYQAKAKVENEYRLTAVNAENVPLDNSDSWNPFVSNWGFMFEGREIDSQEIISVLVIPHNGKVFITEN